MTLETDKQALERAYGLAEDKEFWSSADQNSNLHELQDQIVNQKKADPIPHSIFFSYMRFNTDNSRVEWTQSLQASILANREASNISSRTWLYLREQVPAPADTCTMMLVSNLKI